MMMNLDLIMEAQTKYVLQKRDVYINTGNAAAPNRGITQSRGRGGGGSQ